MARISKKLWVIRRDDFFDYAAYATEALAKRALRVSSWEAPTSWDTWCVTHARKMGVPRLKGNQIALVTVSLSIGKVKTIE